MQSVTKHSHDHIWLCDSYRTYQLQWFYQAVAGMSSGHDSFDNMCYLYFSYDNLC